MNLQFSQDCNFCCNPAISLICMHVGLLYSVYRSRKHRSTQFNLSGSNQLISNQLNYK